MLFSVQSANKNKEHPPFFGTAATTSQVTDVQNSHFLYGDELTNHLRLQSYTWNHTKFYHKKGILQPSISISTKPSTLDNSGTTSRFKSLYLHNNKRVSS